jgi:hypothetical protein
MHGIESKQNTRALLPTNGWYYLHIYACNLWTPLIKPLAGNECWFIHRGASITTVHRARGFSGLRQSTSPAHKHFYFIASQSLRILFERFSIVHRIPGGQVCSEK